MKLIKFFENFDTSDVKLLFHKISDLYEDDESIIEIKCFVKEVSSKAGRSGHFNFEIFNFENMDKSDVVFQITFDSFNNLIDFTSRNFNFGLKKYNISKFNNDKNSMEVEIDISTEMKLNFINILDLVDANIRIRIWSSKIIYINLSDIRY